MTSRGQFKREVIVEIGPPGETGRRYEDVRIAFSGEHKSHGHPGRVKIDLYNVHRDAMAFAKPRRNLVRLFAGHDGSAPLLFQGNPMRDGVSLHVGHSGDRVLSIEASDGGRGFTETYLSTTFATKVTWGDVLTLVLQQTGWSRGAIAMPTSLSTPGPMTLSGNPRQILDRMAQLVPGGGEWFVRDGALYIVERKVGKQSTAN